MKKLLIFHPALAPYRIDQFNALSELFELEVVFIFENVPDNNFDQSKLLSLLQFKYSFLLKGIFIKNRVFRFGMFRTIKRFNPDIIFGYEYSFTTQFLIVLKTFGLIHQKIGSTIDDSIDICYHVQSRSRYFARQISVKRLDYLIVMTREVSQFYQNKFNLKDDQLIVSPILQNPERLRKNYVELQNIAKGYSQKYNLEGKKVLLFVGRFIPEKALPKFLDTFHSLLLEQENLVLVLVGDGEDRHTLEVYVKENQLEHKVFLPGRFEGQQLNAWYLCSSGLVFPSMYEPFGAVVNEALIFGLKVFCSKHAGSSYLVGAEKGIIYDPLSEKEAITKMKIFLSLIEDVQEIDMKKKPSLMLNHTTDFIREWRNISAE